MAAPNPVTEFTRRLEEAGLNYMVTGSVAVILYGEPRLTLDVDLVLDLTEENVSILAEAFPISDFYCPPIEVLTLEATRERRGHFNLIHHESGFKADVYTAGKDPLHVWALARTQRVSLESETLTVAPPEYVIVRKLEFYREGGSEKHVRDIDSILKSLGNSIDFEAVRRFAADRGMTELWQRFET